MIIEFSQTVLLVFSLLLFTELHMPYVQFIDNELKFVTYYSLFFQYYS